MKLIDNNETICSIFVDLSKAFDTFNNQIIQQKLYTDMESLHGETPQLYIQKLTFIMMLLIH